MSTIKLLQGSFHLNVSQVEPNQVTDLEIGDGEVMVFGVTFVLLDCALKLFMEVLVQFLKIRCHLVSTFRRN